VTLAERIAAFVERHGSYRNAAKILETDHAYLWGVAHGTKEPSDKLLSRLGLKRHVHYTVFRERF
jgi:hypothetical protein